MNRLDQQLAFVLEIDKLKTILRQTLLTDSSRRENSAEHSWHLAIMSFLLAEYAATPVDTLRVVKMLLVHDLIEIDAGDTFAYYVGRAFGRIPFARRISPKKTWEGAVASVATSVLIAGGYLMYFVAGIGAPRAIAFAAAASFLIFMNWGHTTRRGKR